MSQGVWDLWEYEDVFQSIIHPPVDAMQGTDVAMSFFTRCVQRGAEMFEDTADNMTGMVVYLNPKGTKMLEASAGAKGGAPKDGGYKTPSAKSGKGGGDDPSRFSV